MVKVSCVVRPHRLEGVKAAVSALDVSGITIYDVRGTGNSPEKSVWFGGADQLISLPLGSKLEVVVPDELQEPVIEAIQASARTGESGDGKIFVERICDAVRIRTEERGDLAV